MISHARLKYDAFRECDKSDLRQHPEELRELYKVIGARITHDITLFATIDSAQKRKYKNEMAP